MKIKPGHFVVLALACAVMSNVSAALLEEIVVTAQKREQNLSDVPIAVQALSGIELEKQAIEMATDLVKLIPGATVTQQASSGTATYSVRGISSYVELDPVVGYYVDELPFAIPGNTYAPPGNLFDLERVEVIRSPQGTLYGQGAMGGVIKLVTKDPDLERGFFGKARVNGNDVEGGEMGFGGDIAVNIPVIEDKLAANLTVSYHDHGGWLDSPDFRPGGASNINAADSLDVRGKILYEHSDDFRAKFSIWHHQTDEPFGNSASFPNPEDRMLTTGGGPTAYNVDYDFYSMFLEKDFGFATAEYSLTYSDWDLEFPVSIPILGIPFVAVFDNVSDAMTHELRFLSNGDGPFNWVAGFYYRDGERTFSSSNGFFGFPLPEEDNLIESNSIAVFGEASYAFFDGFAEVLVGLRWFEDDRDFSQQVAGASTFDEGETFDSVSPRFNLTLRPSDNGMLYFNAAHAFRSGNANAAITVLFNQPNFPGRDIRFVEEDELWTYEVGAKWNFLDGNLVAEVAAFYTEWDDVQAITGSPVALGFQTNAGEAEIKGVEYAFTWATPLEGLTLSASGAFLDAEWGEVDPVLTAFAPLIVEGNDYPSVPDVTYNLSADYSTMIGNNLEFFSFFSYAFRDSHIDVSSIGITAGQLQQGTLRVGVRNEASWEASVFATNLFDEDDMINTINGSVNIPKPRVIGVSFTKHF